MDERLRILKMIEEGIITAEQGEELISAMKLDSPASEEVSDTISYDKKMLRIIVDGANGDKVKVQFPVGAIKKILKVTGKLPIPEKDQFDGCHLGMSGRWPGWGFCQCGGRRRFNRKGLC